jgi:hypothetical protein
MRPYLPDLPRSLLYLGLTTALVLLVISGGCLQQADSSTDTTSGIKVTKPDDSHITIAFVGAPGMDNLLELEYTVTDSNGKSITMSKGSRLATTPIQVHATESFTGSYSGRNHVFVTGYFSDGSHRALIDRDI